MTWSALSLRIALFLATHAMLIAAATQLYMRG
jgi:hypothetical protein